MNKLCYYYYSATDLGATNHSAHVKIGGSIWRIRLVACVGERNGTTIRFDRQFDSSIPHNPTLSTEINEYE